MWQTQVVAYPTPISPHPSQPTAPDFIQICTILEEVGPSPNPSSPSGSPDSSKPGCGPISLASYRLSLCIWPKRRVGSLLRAFWERFSSHLKKRHCKKIPASASRYCHICMEFKNCGTGRGVN
ncbi:hypothetical protein HJG60_008204 [Phyllostomus discolor]|uniref:Uncharacterized protein n=1 Tax=Phyllostomus discolor TaxID=89673 RepID=A0A834DSI4_9CHIR|nr:hypothetical protein HJG60_008204 [Phyllostomus discolor]